MMTSFFLFKPLYSLYKLIIDFIYPPYCSCCNSILNEGKDLLCNTCWNHIPAHHNSHSVLIELFEKHNQTCYMSQLHALWQFDTNTQYVIHKLKYQHHRWMANKIAFFMAEYIKINDNLQDIDLIIPVPLHRRRIKKRGYNQSQLISNALSNLIDVPVNTNSLKRVRHTKSQTKLNAQQRIQNVATAFRISEQENIQQKNILLIDDVITTGSTINFCAKQLIEHGAKEVYAMSAAKA